MNTKPKNEAGSTDFIVRIMFRQHTSWQGEIEWVGKPEEPRRWFFRSLLELIVLMQEAIELEGRVHAEDTFQTWDDEER